MPLIQKNLGNFAIKRHAKPGIVNNIKKYIYIKKSIENIQLVYCRNQN